MSPSSPRTRNSRRLKRQLRVMGVLLLLGLAGWGWVAITPWRLCREAEKLLAENPRAAELLLAESVEKSGGVYPKAQLLRARALGAMGRWTEAAGAFALIEDPAQCPPEHLVLLASEAWTAGQTLLSQLCLTVVSEQPEPLAVSTRQRLIHLLLDRREWQAAREQANLLAATDPQNPLPLLADAKFQESQGNFLESARDFERYLSHPGEKADQSSAREDLVGVLISLGEIQSARKELDHLRKSGPLSVTAQLREIWLLRLEGKPDDALKEIQLLLNNHPDHPQALVLRGTLRLDRGDVQGAIQDLTRACEGNPYHKEAHFKLGTALARIGERDQAEYHFLRSRDLTDASIRILELESSLAANRDQTEQWQELLRLYEKAGRDTDAARVRNYLERHQVR